MEQRRRRSSGWNVYVYAGHTQAQRARGFPASVRVAVCSVVVTTLISVLMSGPASGAGAATMTALVGRAGTPLLTSETTGLSINRVPAGSYVIEVRDRSSKQNFHLKLQGARGLDRRTTIRFVGRVKWTVTLAPGAYVYFSDNRPAAKRRLTVY
jgi:hypothetical protein